MIHWSINSALTFPYLIPTSTHVPHTDKPIYAHKTIRIPPLSLSLSEQMTLQPQINSLVISIHVVLKWNCSWGNFYRRRKWTQKTRAQILDKAV